MKIAIVGSRKFKRLDAVREFVEKLPEGTVVVTGGAKGVDRVAEMAAAGCGLETVVFLPKWAKYGKRAGFVRNERIVEMVDEVVAFWDGESKGTEHTIGLARESGKPVRVYGKGK